METNFYIKDMSCANCAKKIETRLKKIKGIKSNINIDSKTLTIKSKSNINESEIINAISDAGYTATLTQ